MWLDVSSECVHTARNTRDALASRSLILGWLLHHLLSRHVVWGGSTSREARWRHSSSVHHRILIIKWVIILHLHFSNVLEVDAAHFGKLEAFNLVVMVEDAAHIFWRVALLERFISILLLWLVKDGGRCTRQQGWLVLGEQIWIGGDALLWLSGVTWLQTRQTTRLSLQIWSDHTRQSLFLRHTYLVEPIHEFILWQGIVKKLKDNRWGYSTFTQEVRWLSERTLTFWSPKFYLSLSILDLSFLESCRSWNINTD